MPTISTTAKPVYVYDQTSDTWFPLGPAAQANLTVFQYTATANQTTFSGGDANGLTLSYVPGAINVFLNGVLQVPTADYTATSGSSVVLTSGAASGDVLTVVAFATFSVANTYTQAQANAQITGQTSVMAFLLMGV